MKKGRKKVTTKRESTIPYKSIFTEKESFAIAQACKDAEEFMNKFGSGREPRKYYSVC